jgi:hypothetical protein
MTTHTEPRENDLRQVAITHLRKKREFLQHITVYAVVTVVLTLIWLFTTPGGFYWPMFPILIWGIGVAFHAMDVFTSVFTPASPSEQQIEREIGRLTHR